MAKPLTLFLYKSCEDNLCNKSYSILTNRNKQLVRVFSKVVDSLDGKEVNIVITDGKTIKGLNEQFRGKKGETDILTFPLESKVYGELWLCPKVIEENAKRFEEDFEKEFLRITIHGLLHLCGMDHKGHFGKKSIKSEKMFALQEEILEMLY